MSSKRFMRLGLVSAVAAALVGTATATAAGGSQATHRSATARAAATCVSTAKAAIKKAEAPVPVSLPKTPVDMAKNKGKSVWMIQEVNNPLGQTIGNGFLAAGRQAGMKPKVVYGDGTSASWNADVQEAVAQKAKAIVLYGIAPGQVPTPLAKAIAKKTVIVDIFNGSPNDPLPHGVYAHVTPDFHQAGINMANWELAYTSCHLDTAVFGAEVLLLHKEFMNSFNKTVTSACSSCKVLLENVDLGTLATAFGPQVNNVLTANPGINVLSIVFDAGVQLVEPSIQTSFSKLPVASHDGVAANLDTIRSGGQQVYDGAFAPPTWIGYAAVDEIGRGLAGQKPQKWVIPERAIDKTNIGSSNASIWANWSHFQKGFLKAWGVK